MDYLVQKEKASRYEVRLNKASAVMVSEVQLGLAPALIRFIIQICNSPKGKGKKAGKAIPAGKPWAIAIPKSRKDTRMRILCNRIPKFHPEH